MTAITITQARANLYKLAEDVCASSQPVTITNNRGTNCVLIGEDDWNAIQETLYLNSVPGLVQSIQATKDEDVAECSQYNPDESW